MDKLALDRYKTMLIDRKTELLNIISNYQKEISQLQSSEAKDEVDFATISSDSARQEAITLQQKQELEDINYSLKKIDDATYGICEMCEEDIGDGRLTVKPQARYCIVCREIVEKTT
jgi:DnaK suppressor protein